MVETAPSSLFIAYFLRAYSTSPIPGRYIYDMIWMTHVSRGKNHSNYGWNESVLLNGVGQKSTFLSILHEAKGFWSIRDFQCFQTEMI